MQTQFRKNQLGFFWGGGGTDILEATFFFYSAAENHYEEDQIAPRRSNNVKLYYHCSDTEEWDAVAKTKPKIWENINHVQETVQVA